MVICMCSIKLYEVGKSQLPDQLARIKHILPDMDTAAHVSQAFTMIEQMLADNCALG